MIILLVRAVMSKIFSITLGKMDCANGFDERRCDELEMNECNNETEFRCQNGHCIDKTFYLDGDYDCLDSSDEFSNNYYSSRCGYQHSIQCSNQICPSTLFSCGNGECYNGPNIYPKPVCSSHRDLLYFQKMPSSTLTLFSHVALIYNDTQPEWICYNHTLCPQLSSNDFTVSNWQKDESIVCRKFTVLMNRTYAKLFDLINSFKNFVGSCWLPAIVQSSINCSMFSCGDHSKCLSHHRLTDGYNDCPNGEDERISNTCSLGLANRYACDDGTRCIPVRLIGDAIVSIHKFFTHHSISTVDFIIGSLCR